ncbi:MAG: hypothetical protein RL685_3371 [Pseudomonadota bacterium]|jgi:hypothetical protein
MKQNRAPVQRRDSSGHLNPGYARHLLARARENHNDANDARSRHAFFSCARTADEYAEGLGESFIESATSGEGSSTHRHEEVTWEEEGGPFVLTTAAEEFAEGMDESNIAEATREPFPMTSHASPSTRRSN